MNRTKQKIIIVGPGYPYRNGPAIYLSHLCGKLAADYDVQLVNYTMLYPGFLFPGKTQYDDSKEVLSFPNIRLVNSLNPFSWIKTAAYINKQNPDLIVFDWWHPFFAPCHKGIVTFLKSSLKKKIVYLTENVISHEANKTDKMLTRLALNNARCFLALSNAVEKHLQSMFDKKVFRSELPIYDFYSHGDKQAQSRQAKTSLGFDAGDTVFLFFGLVRRYKGLDLLLEAFGNLAKERKGIKLLVVGEFYEDDKPYTDIVKNHGMEDKVVIENRYVPNEEVEKYLLASDVAVLPYRSATQSGVLNVAYGFYKPAIVTNVGELGSLVEEGTTGIVVPEPSVAAIQDGMQKFLELKGAGTSFGASIKQYIADRNQFKFVNRVFGEILSYVNSSR